SALPCTLIFFSSRRRHTRFSRDWSSDVCSSDLTHRNVFADYYGDLHFLNGTVPKRHVEYVLITPASREMYVNEPALEGLQRERRSEERRVGKECRGRWRQRLDVKNRRGGAVEKY